MPLRPFSEVRLPTAISLGSTFGFKTVTEVTLLASGYERRKNLWPTHRYQADIRYGVRTLAQLQQLDTFFRCRRGKAQAFRVKNHSDYTAVQQFVGLGDGSTSQYQLLKIYDSGAQEDQYVRAIRKPVGIDSPLGNAYDSVTLYQDGTLMESGYGVDYSTGIVTLSVSLPVGVTLTWSGEFDIPMRFDVDYLPLSLAQFGIGQTAQSIPLVEVLPFPTFPAELAA